MRVIKYKEAISEATIQCMENDPNIFITGHAVDYPSGIFGTTNKVSQAFPSRVFDCPSMENAFMGIAVGAAAVGKRPVFVLPRADFMFLAFDNLINLAAKWKYMFNGNAGTVPIVVRAVVGKGWGQGATHSQSLHAPLSHFPGITVALPSSPSDAKGILTQALISDHPVVIFEHRSLFELEDNVPSQNYSIPFGKARIVREGTDLTIVALSAMVREAQLAAMQLENVGVSTEIIDPRTVRPFDEQTVLNSIRKTGRLLVADTSWEMCGFASEVSAMVAEKGFEYLKEPVRRLSNANCPTPVSKPLEDAFYPKASNIAQIALHLLKKECLNLLQFDDFADNFKGPY